MSPYDAGMMSPTDITHHVTSLDMQFMIVLLNVRTDEGVGCMVVTHTHVGADGASKTKRFRKICYPPKTGRLPRTDLCARIRPVTLT